MKHLSKILFLLLTIFCNSIVISQVAKDEVLRHTLLISTKKHNQNNSEYKTLVDEAANKFDVEKFIQENISTMDIRIVGTITSYEKTIKIDFDSKKMDFENGCNQICKSIVSVEKAPLMGMSVMPMDDLQGVLVETVYEGSAAHQAGIQQGDMITYIDTSFIQSGCEMNIIMVDAEIGEVMDVHLKDNDRTEIIPIVLGYKILEKVTYDYCCPIEITESSIVHNNTLTVFPNPTDGLTQVKFHNTQKGNLKISITDIAGHQVQQMEVKDFSGFWNASFDFTKYASGLYFLQIKQGQEIWMEKIVLQKM